MVHPQLGNRVAAPHFVHAPVDHELAFEQQRHAVAKGLHHAHLVGREDHRAAGRADLRDQVPDQHRVDRVEAGERLVEHAQLGVAQERGGELHLLAHTLAQALHVLIRGFSQTNTLEPAQRSRSGVAAAEALELAEVDHHVDDLLLGVETTLLGQIGEAIQVLSFERLAEELDATGVGAHDVHDHADRRGLAGAVRAEQAEDLAWSNLERNGGERYFFAVAFPDVFQEEHAHGRQPPIMRQILKLEGERSD